ncbi:MAG: class I adenylate-forming enzyme family protein [Acidimicrobiales bacterium]
MSSKRTTGTGRLHDGLARAAAEQPDSVAVLAGEEAWTFRRLDRAANALAAHLATRGVGPGDRVAVMTANRPEFVVATHALSKLGAASVLLNSSWKALEVSTALDLTGASVAVADGAASTLLADRLGAGRVVDVDEDGASAGLTASVADLPADPPAGGRCGPGDESLLVFSSGTTDRPKAVRHTHRSITVATGHWASALGLGPTDRFQVATPPSHILGLLNLLAAAAAGATVRLHRRFDLDEILRRIEEERVTLEMAVAPIALAMAGHPRLEDYDLSSLRYVMWCATPVTESVAQEVTRRTGVRWLTAYGASELPVIACNPVADPDAWRLDSVGLPPPGVELRIADLDTGEVLDPGGVGEVQVRSPSAMAGYLPDEASAEAFAGGVGEWYRTGDVGWLEPDGWVHLTDRRKEMIKVRGFQVAPAEIEGVLHGHPAVVDCAVFGLPDGASGEVPVAAVTLEPGWHGDVAELEALVAETLAGYKRLHRVVVVDAIPRLPSGKVLRRSLRDELGPLLAADGRRGAPGPPPP